MKKINKNIVLIGMPGCGKTTTGKILSQKIKLKLYDLDECIEKSTGKTIKELFSKSEKVFRDAESKITEQISSTYPKIISTGGGIVKRENNIHALKKNGIIIFINRPIEDIISDINTNTRPLLKDGKEKLYKLYDERIELYKKYCDIEIINDETIEKTIKSIIEALSI
ncbi:shikimate kinase [Haloimpatiens sp. FM7330]|uniref:shikimate kinase n=1 Tax=Haloimpatiens sp. FM7330 TaxID=3298610 RepID=UPI003632420C